MARKARVSLITGALGSAALILLMTNGCGDILRNQTAERTGDISVVVINSTPFTASFSYGSWDAWDRNPPGQVELQQLVLAANTTSDAASFTCARNFAIATADFITRADAVDAQDSTADFNPDAFDTVVHFSNVAPGSPGDALPTIGTAAGLERLLGVDYECGDELIFTLVEDPDAPGGFRVDFSDIRGPEE